METQTQALERLKIPPVGSNQRKKVLSATKATAYERRDALLATARERSLTADEERQLDAAMEDLNLLNTELAAEQDRQSEAIEDWRARRGITHAGEMAETGGANARFDDGDRVRLDPADAIARMPSDAWARAAVEPFRGRRYADMFRGQGLSTDGFRSFDEFLGAVHAGVHHPQLQAAMGTGMGSHGGFLVPTQFAAQALDAALELEIVRPRADAQPMESKVKTVAGFDCSDNSASNPYGIKAEWTAENAESTDQEAKLRAIEFTAKTLRLYVAASNELVQDGTDFEQQLGRAMVLSMAWGFDDNFLNGTGVGQPLGVVNDPALIAVAKESGQLNNTIVYENLVNMVARLHPASFGRSVWVANVSTLPQLLTLTSGAAGAQHLSQVPVLTQNGETFAMLTRPVLWTEKLPALGTKGDLLLVDFSQYGIGLRKEAQLERSQHVRWHKNQTSYRVILRGDGFGKWNGPFTPKQGPTLSWCVAIADR